MKNSSCMAAAGRGSTSDIDDVRDIIFACACVHVVAKSFIFYPSLQKFIEVKEDTRSVIVYFTSVASLHFFCG